MTAKRNKTMPRRDDDEYLRWREESEHYLRRLRESLRKRLPELEAKLTQDERRRSS